MLCTSGSVVEYRLAKARVAGSNPVSCSQRDRKKSHPMDGSFFYVRALPGSNGSNVSAPLRSSQANVPRTFCDVSCSQWYKKETSDGCLFFIFKPCRARTVRKSLPYLALVAQQIWVPLFHNLGAAVCRHCWVGPINGVWLKCLSLGEQIRAYEKMFKKYSKFVAYML